MATNNAVNLKSSGIVSYDGAGTFSALANPLTVANGGTSDASLTAYAVLCGGTSSTNPVQSIASVGTSGQVLLSNGASNLPSFQTLNGLGYTLYLCCTTTSNPSDSSTYFLSFGAAITSSGGSGTSQTRIYVPNAATVVACYGSFRVAGTLGSSQNSTLSIRLNNSSDTTVTSTLQLTAVDNPFSNNGLSISVSAGDYLEYKLVTPVWSPNPTTVTCTMTMYLQ